MNKTPYLSKSDFLRYQICPSYLWLWKFKRESVPENEDITAKRRMKQGNDVEKVARELFPEAALVDARYHQARQQTEELAAKGKAVIFQATVFTDNGLLAKADILKYNSKTKIWDLYEVKSNTEVEKEHLYDVAFQKAAFEESGYKIGKLYLMHLNKDYVMGSKLVPAELFTQEDITDKAEAILPVIRQQINDALEMLKQTKEPKGCSCRLKSRSQHCPTFRYLNPDIPEYSVFDIARIGGKKLALLIDSEIYSVHDVPEDIKLTVIQKNQVQVAKNNEPIINKSAVEEMLAELEYPLYFLDYETVSTALPMYKGCRPYQQLPFQYSAHVLDTPNGQLRQHEFLGRGGQDPPMPKLLSSLSRDVGASGSVVVWNQAFEIACNKDMAKMYPAHAKFLDGINARVFDLMHVFRNQHYAHPGFNGSNSIKNVLPVLVPEFSYEVLDIRSGDVAAIRWYDAITGAINAAQAEKTFSALLEYCRLDTLAMVKIYEKLKAL